MSREIPEAVRYLVDRQLGAEEFRAWAAAPLAPDPSPEARLAYVRKKYAEWTRNQRGR